MVWPFARVMGDYKEELRLIRSSGGLQGEGIGDPEGRISETVVRRLLELSLQRTGRPDLGLLAGARIEPGDFGVVDAAARCAPDFGVAMRVFARNMGLLDDITRAEVETVGDMVHWRLLQPGRERPAASNDFQLRAAVELGQQWLGLRAPPAAVHFAHERPDYADRYEEAFGCPVLFRQHANAVLFPRLAEQLPVIGCHPDLFEAFEARANKQLSERLARRGFAFRVEQAILRTLPDGPTNMVVVAEQLNMSVATLRRRLDDEGTTHQNILSAVRKREATRRLVQTDQSVSQIAFALGFAAPQAFCRAFRRWTGQSPAEYRDWAQHQTEVRGRG